MDMLLEGWTDPFQVKGEKSLGGKGRFKPILGAIKRFTAVILNQTQTPARRVIGHENTLCLRGHQLTKEKIAKFSTLKSFKAL
jgi:hypothetical protein